RGVRRPSAAFKGSAHAEYVRFTESPYSFSRMLETMNLTMGRNLFGVPPSGGPNRLKPGHQTVGSWKAPFRLFFACIETMNRYDKLLLHMQQKFALGKVGSLRGRVACRAVSIG